MGKRKELPVSEDSEEKQLSENNLYTAGAETTSNLLEGDDGCRLATRDVSRQDQDLSFSASEQRGEAVFSSPSKAVTIVPAAYVRSLDKAAAIDSSNTQRTAPNAPEHAVEGTCSAKQVPVAVVDARECKPVERSAKELKASVMEVRVCKKQRISQQGKTDGWHPFSSDLQSSDTSVLLGAGEAAAEIVRAVVAAAVEEKRPASGKEPGNVRASAQHADVHPVTASKGLENDPSKELRVTLMNISQKATKSRSSICRQNCDEAATDLPRQADSPSRLDPASDLKHVADNLQSKPTNVKMQTSEPEEAGHIPQRSATECPSSQKPSAPQASTAGQTAATTSPRTRSPPSSTQIKAVTVDATKNVRPLRTVNDYEKRLVMVDVALVGIPSLTVRPCDAKSQAVEGFVDCFLQRAYGESGRLISVAIAPDCLLSKADALAALDRQPIGPEPPCLTSIPGMSVHIVDGVHRLLALKTEAVKKIYSKIQAYLFVRKDSLPFHLGDFHTIGFRENDMDREGKATTIYDRIHICLSTLVSTLQLPSNLLTLSEFNERELKMILSLRQKKSVASLRSLITARGICSRFSSSTLDKYCAVALGLFKFQNHPHVLASVQQSMSYEKGKGTPELPFSFIVRHELWSSNSVKQFDFLFETLRRFRYRLKISDASVAEVLRYLTQFWSAVIGVLKEKNVVENTGLELRIKLPSHPLDPPNVRPRFKKLSDRLHDWMSSVDERSISSPDSWNKTQNFFIDILRNSIQWPNSIASAITSHSAPEAAPFLDEAPPSSLPSCQFHGANSVGDYASKDHNNLPMPMKPRRVITESDEDSDSDSDRSVTSSSSESEESGRENQNADDLKNGVLDRATDMASPNLESSSRPESQHPASCSGQVTKPLLNSPRSRLELNADPASDLESKTTGTLQRGASNAAEKKLSDIKPTIARSAKRRCASSSLRVSKKNRKQPWKNKRDTSPVPSRIKISVMTDHIIPAEQRVKDTDEFFILAKWKEGFVYSRPRPRHTGFDEVTLQSGSDPSHREPAKAAQYIGTLKGYGRVPVYNDTYETAVTISTPWNLLPKLPERGSHIWKLKYDMPSTPHCVYPERHLEPMLRSLGFRPPHQSHWRLTMADLCEIRWSVFDFMTRQTRLPKKSDNLWHEVWQDVGEAIFKGKRELLDERGYIIFDGFVRRTGVSLPQDKWPSMFDDIKKMFKFFDEDVPDEDTYKGYKKKCWTREDNADGQSDSDSSLNSRWATKSFCTNTRLEANDKLHLMKGRIYVEVSNMVLAHFLHLEGSSFDEDVDADRSEGYADTARKLYATDAGSRVFATGFDCVHQMPHTVFFHPPTVQTGVYPETITFPGYFTISTGPEGGRLWILKDSHRYIFLEDEEVKHMSQAVGMTPVKIPPWSVFLGRGDFIHGGMGSTDSSKQKFTRLYDILLREGLPLGNNFDCKPMWRHTQYSS